MSSKGLEDWHQYHLPPQLAMGRFSLLSIGLFILPIAITLAILIGVETWRVSTGKLPLSSQDNRITTKMYCQQEYGVQPNPGRYVCKSSPLH